MKAAPLLLLLGAAGCAAVPPAIGEPGAELPDAKAEARYQTALARATEHREVYAGLDTRLYCAATYQSPEFREARVRRQALFQSWPEAKLDETLAREHAAAAESHELVFGVSLVDRRFDDFDSRGTIWRLSLATDQGEVAPLAIKRVGRANQDIRAYYPYMGDFWTMYAVRFPMTVAGHPLVGPATQVLLFRMSSTQGQVEMRFPVGAPPAPGPTPPPAVSTSRAAR
ncbi:MAG TPA: hypothetical protein VMT11_03415 [Myxococcaceae bacterium]|nr:hypothetical protein [Myxococcaceae bacterium]